MHCAEDGGEHSPAPACHWGCVLGAVPTRGVLFQPHKCCHAAACCADFVWVSDGVKDFHTQDRLRLPAEDPLPQRKQKGAEGGWGWGWHCMRGWVHLQGATRLQQHPDLCQLNHP
jgi:hypothetical protein